MNSQNILQFIKEVIPCITNTDGSFRETPIGMVQTLSQDRVDFLKEVVRLVLSTNIVSKETKVYIQDPYISYRKVSDKINRELKEGEKQANANTVASKIQYDRKKLTLKFGTNMALDIFTQGKSLETYREKIAQAYTEYGNANTKLRSNLLIDIPKDCINTEISEEEFNNFLDIIKPYIKSQVEFISNNIPKESCGYFNYLLSDASLSRTDEERLAIIKSFLEY